MLSNPNATARVRIAFLLLFAFTIVLSIGAYFVANLGKLQESVAAREGQAALHGITDPKQIDEVLRRHPSNRFLQLIAMAIRAANETRAATEKMSSEVEPPALKKDVNLGAAGRSDLEALRSDLKIAGANAATFMPRYVALLKAERDKVENHALSLHVENDTIVSLLEGVDKRQAKSIAFTSKMSLARADYYRAYENYVAVLLGEFGSYKVVDGQFIFPLQRTVDRYNVAAQAMAAAARHVAELEEGRKTSMPSQQEEWEQFVSSK